MWKVNINASVTMKVVEVAWRPAGALSIFQRSEELHGVRYIKYLGDGNSKGFLAVRAAKPYGNVAKICKLECIGHVQKRMDTHLQRLKKENEGNKLSEGKVISRQGRLTDAMINKIQMYYGLAIRRHIGSLDDMRRAVWATTSTWRPQRHIHPMACVQRVLTHGAVSTRVR